MRLATSKPTQPRPSTQASAQAWWASDRLCSPSTQVAGDVAGRHAERARGRDEDVGVVLAHALAVGQRLGGAGVGVGAAGHVVDAVAHQRRPAHAAGRAGPAPWPRRRARGWRHRAGSAASRAGRRAHGEVLGSPATTPLQSVVSTVPPASITSSWCGVLMVMSCTRLPKPSLNCSTEPKPGVRTCQSSTRWPLKDDGRQPQALDRVADRLRVGVAGDVADGDQHGRELLIRVSR